jgi:hypothetical protein
MSWITGKPEKDELAAAELKARVAELESSHNSLKAENERLAKENRSLRDRVAMMERGRAQMGVPTAAHFIEGHGVLWQQAADGRIEAICYCPTCKLVMTPLPSGYPEEVVCTSCKYKAPFHPEKLADVAHEVRSLAEGKG